MKRSVARRSWFLWFAACSAVALAGPQSLDAGQWLFRIQQAALKLNYGGTFVYLQQGGQPQTSRISHVVDGSQVRERLEMLDGLPLVIVRNNEEVRTYSPDTKTVVVEKRQAKANFPALPTDQVASIVEQYRVSKWDSQRVAGIDCQVLLLEPRDGLRYTHKMWADMNSGLLIKSQVFNEKGEIVEQIAFTQVDIGGPAEKYLPRIAKRDGGRDWRIATPLVTEANFADAGWTIANPVPGFRKVLEMRRGAGDTAVGQVVFSDGLASVSVFLEQLQSAVKAQEGLSSQGAVNVFRRKVGDHLVTVLGEAPPACVTRIGRAVEFKPPPR